MDSRRYRAKIIAKTHKKGQISIKEKQPLQIGDIVDDFECIEIIHERYNHNITKFYIMKCKKCGRTKKMSSPTIRRHSGTSHKACGKGLKTKDPIFYKRWQAMRTRTTNPNYHGHQHYLDKQINSDEFQYFIDFYDAMYKSYKALADKIGPENTSLERIDNNKPYCKTNCKWIPKQDQPKNTSRIAKFEVTFPDGHKEIHHNVREFAITHNLDANTILDCMNPKRCTKSHKKHKFKRL